MESRRSPPLLRFPFSVPVLGAAPERRGGGETAAPGPHCSLPRGPVTAGQRPAAATTSAPAALAGAGPRESYRDACLRFFFFLMVLSSLLPALSANFRRRPARHGAITSSSEQSRARGSRPGRRRERFALAGSGRLRAAVGGGARPPRPLAGESGGAGGWA